MENLDRVVALSFDLWLILVCTYGASWLLVKAKLSLPVRDFFMDRGPVFIATMLECIVCTGCWLTVPVTMLVASSSLSMGGVPVVFGSHSVVILLLWVALGWATALRMGDAD